MPPEAGPARGLVGTYSPIVDTGLLVMLTRIGKNLAMFLQTMVSANLVLLLCLTSQFYFLGCAQDEIDRGEFSLSQAIKLFEFVISQ